MLRLPPCQPLCWQRLPHRRSNASVRQHPLLSTPVAAALPNKSPSIPAVTMILSRSPVTTVATVMSRNMLPTAAMVNVLSALKMAAAAS